ncbi:hypothetical protein KUTeg_015141 [Tegillarca granosa]|uniref:Protein kinase domain-containing protein n=1 Tax=Tegillarca granosa TaxID=220873 RepID=A0ABQ9EP98_TEGGR|nr:hypothetical protein KUTeg_015141 [Tegillarca granosa]
MKIFPLYPLPIPLSAFRVEEIQAWVDLNGTGICPKLYLFHLEGNNVLIHMEILEKAITLRDITDKHMEKFWSEKPEPAKLFSLYILHYLLDTVPKMHDKGWAHKDLHGKCTFNVVPSAYKVVYFP